ncbi:hypothetical protein TWF102_005047, partial [Orbilia oligospora]
NHLYRPAEVMQHKILQIEDLSMRLHSNSHTGSPALYFCDTEGLLQMEAQIAHTPLIKQLSLIAAPSRLPNLLHIELP